jgi:hypothetical protein
MAASRRTAPCRPTNRLDPSENVSLRISPLAPESARARKSRARVRAGDEPFANERLAVLEQKVSHMEAELDRMSGKVDEMHAILLQARGVRWAIIAVSGLVGFLVGIAHWFVAKA